MKNIFLKLNWQDSAIAFERNTERNVVIFQSLTKQHKCPKELAVRSSVVRHICQSHRLGCENIGYLSVCTCVICKLPTNRQGNYLKQKFDAIQQDNVQNSFYLVTPQGSLLVKTKYSEEVIETIIRRLHYESKYQKPTAFHVPSFCYQFSLIGEIINACEELGID